MVITPQQQRALEFISLVGRDVRPIVRHRGYDMEKPGGVRRVGFVRFNIGGTDRGKYRVYVYEPFSDPRGMFVDNMKAGRGMGWTCVVHPDDVEGMEYVISVLESSYDQK